MTDIVIRTQGRAGCITLNRPQALNALTWDMVTAIEKALDGWRNDPAVTLVMIDGAGERAFCSGGDITEMYASAKRGDLDYGRAFWRDEYRLNAKLSNYPKPVVTFLHGFTMGGGVGVGCHNRHRIVGETSQIAMPECTIGLVPDVGGSLLLARAPGFLGEYLGLTGDRMDAGDAIHAGFADTFVTEAAWPALKETLAATGDPAAIAGMALPNPDSRLAAWASDINAVFSGDTLADIYNALPAVPSAPLAHALDRMSRNAPLAMAVAVQIIHAVRARPDILSALGHEFRYTFRAVAQGDFIEGIRAVVIEKDHTPHWQHRDWQAVTDADVAAMTAPLGADALHLEETA
jgi:enoyl-CoA hydratase